LYLPVECCKDATRRKKARIPEEVEFQTKPQLGVTLGVRVAGWKVRKAPVLGDCLRATTEWFLLGDRPPRLEFVEAS
jgi:hypothetical protein